MKQSLNFNWKYIPNFKQEYLISFPNEVEIVDIPHSISLVPYNYFSELDYQKVVTYQKIFDIENVNDIYLLRFEGFMLQADIYLNNNYLGHYISGYLPIEIDVTSFIKEKDNVLTAILDSKEDPNIPPFGYAVDYLTFSGIYREVYLISHPKNYIKNIYVNGDITGKTKVIYDEVGNINAKYELFDKDNNLVISSNTKEFNISNPHLWDIDDPYLYSLVITTSEEEKYEVKFGYKKVSFTSKGFFLNNKHLKLRGLNRHQNYPYVGYAMPKSMQEDDALKLKQLGINVVRTSHYPQSEHFLTKCDEIGLLVVDEIPGWQHISNNESWRELYYDFISRMVYKERNHTSLIAYGVRIDESQDDHELYSKGNEIAHKLDPYKATIGVRNFKGSELLEDVYGYNDFSCSDMSHGLDNPSKTTKNKNAPILITEYMGHMEPIKPTSDIDKRILVALRHAKVLDDAIKYERLSGSIGWCFVDYYTHVDFGSGDHLCPHGVLDLYRNKKYSASIYESQSEDHPVLDILTNMRPGDFKEATYQDIYVATNMDKVDLYKNDEFVASFYPNKKQFKYLSHPPIKIDDVLGESFKDDRFTSKECKKLAKAFSYGGLYGFNHLKLSHYINVAKIYFKYHLKWGELVDIWNKHISTWGGYAKTFTFKGIKDGKEIISKTIRPSLNFKYVYKVDRNILKEEDTYDVTTIKVTFEDLDGNVMPYANKPIEISTSGNIELIGPSLQTLLGGQLTIYIRSKGKGEGQVNISTEIENKQIDLFVE